jgi:hypothetical protein
MAQNLRAVPSQASDYKNASRRANQIVSEIGTLDFQGNTLPHSWFKTPLLRKVTKHGPKQYLLATLILGEVVYWYRPEERADEETQETYYQRRFVLDMFRTAYIQLARKFGVSKDQTIAAVDFLVKQGLLRREFRTIRGPHVPLSNVLFLEPVVGKVREITRKLTKEELAGWGEDE